MKLWQKNYSLNKEIEKFTVGNDFLLDKELVEYDCLASIAHAECIKHAGIINENELKELKSALKEIAELSSKGEFEIKQEDEDCHTAIENFLTKKLGHLGKKIHTGRSRNDQVLAALRLYYKDKIKDIESKINTLVEALKEFSTNSGSIKMPGYTHMRKAMPSSVELWADAFISSMADNKKLLKSVNELINQSPLGSGAGYGVPIKLDKNISAKTSGFEKVQENPLYVQNSRGKFESSILHVLTQVMFDINKISSDIILFSMNEFGFFKLNDEICTGSSIMPHKKNPDALELLRAKYHEVLAAEIQVKSLASNLISGYHRDLQLTKEPVMKSFDTTIECLKIMRIVIQNITVDKEKCESALTEELFAAQKALELSNTGVSFRDAYNEIAKKY